MKTKIKIKLKATKYTVNQPSAMTALAQRRVGGRMRNWRRERGGARNRQAEYRADASESTES